MRRVLVGTALLAATLWGCDKGPASGPAPPLGNNSTANSGPASPGASENAIGSPEALRPVSGPTNRQKIDETAQGAYADSSGCKAEVVGVCSITEGSVSCWTADGKPDAGLTKKITDALKNPRASRSDKPTFGLKYGRKNRIVLVMVSEPRHVPGQPHSSISVESFGSDNAHRGGHVDLVLSMLMPPSSEGVSRRIECRSVSEPLNGRETKVVLHHNVPIPEVRELPCRVGETVNLGGQMYRISAIYPGVKEQYLSTLASRRGAKWTLELERNNVAGASTLANMTLQDADGKPLVYSDEEGTPYARETFEDYVRQGGGSPRGVGTVISAVYNSPRRVSAILYVDPAKVGKIVLTGTRTKVVEIGGIQLDPKK